MGRRESYTLPPSCTDSDGSSSSQASTQDDGSDGESYVESEGSFDEEEDSGDTVSSESVSVLPDKVKSNHTLTSVLVPDKVNSKAAVKEEEEESTDEEGYGEMGMQARKKRIKVEPQVKTEEVSTDDEDEGMADDKSSSPAVTDKLKIKKEKYDMEVETGTSFMILGCDLCILLSVSLYMPSLFWYRSFHIVRYREP